MSAAYAAVMTASSRKRAGSRPQHGAPLSARSALLAGVHLVEQLGRERDRDAELPQRERRVAVGVEAVRRQARRRRIADAALVGDGRERPPARAPVPGRPAAARARAGGAAVRGGGAAAAARTPDAARA